MSTPRLAPVPVGALALLASLALSASITIAPSASAQGTVLVEAGTPMRYLGNGGNPGIGQAWTDEVFDDSGWPAGVFGVGYEANPPGGAEQLTTTAVPDTTISVYARATFDIVNLAGLTNLLVGADYDDGWAAWINGTEVYRSPEMAGGVLDWNSFTTALHESSNAPTPDYRPLVDITAAASGALREGQNVLAVGAWNRNAESSDLVLVPQLIRDLTATGTVDRGPYLQVATPNSIIVRWRTAAPTDSVVWYGPAPGQLASMASDATVTTEHEVLVTGLAPATHYYYAIGSTGDGVISGDDPDHHFHSPPLPGTERRTRIWAIGDSGTANLDARNVRDAFRDFTGNVHADVWLMLGDNAYDDGTEIEYQRAVFDTYPDVLKQIPLWPTLGNHDQRSANSLDESGVYYDTFTLPRAGEAGGVASGTEAYYSFDHANVHFICLDTADSDMTSDGDMVQWMVQDLADTQQDWIIAFWHHPPYTKGTHDSDTEWRHGEIRENALPFLEGAGVDLVLGGHSHDYERSYLIDGHVGDSNSYGPANEIDGGDGRIAGNGEYAKPTYGLAPHEGAVYVVAGSSGKVDFGLPLDHEAMYVGVSELGSMVIDVAANRLDAYFVDDTGAVIDDFTIVKGCAGAPCTETDCGNGQDDDSDGAADCADRDCTCPESGNCADGVDNDLDWLIDCDDPDCAADPGCLTATEADCTNLADDDSDGATDCDDTDCDADPACLEQGNCGDGIDNDDDGATDCDDTDCAADPACPETDCTNLADDDSDGATDCDDTDCDADAACLEQGNCGDGIDNDDDGATDCDDTDCAADPACPETDCTNLADDDSDGTTDCDDTDCIGVNADGDDVPDCQDCAPLDPGAWAEPPEVTLDVRRVGAPGSNDADVEWTDASGDAGPDTVYDVFTGRIGALWTDRDFRGASCLSNATPPASIRDSRPPGGPGDGFWFLVRSSNACGDSTVGAGAQPRALPATGCD